MRFTTDKTGMAITEFSITIDTFPQVDRYAVGDMAESTFRVFAQAHGFRMDTKWCEILEDTGTAVTILFSS